MYSLCFKILVLDLSKYRYIKSCFFKRNAFMAYFIENQIRLRSFTRIDPITRKIVLKTMPSNLVSDKNCLP